MGPTTQNQFLKRVKAFFRWAYEFEHIQKDPAKALKSIAFHPEKTMPLTSEQFDQVLAAVDLCDVDRKRKEDRFGVELRAVCLVMRWTGLRITDVLMLPRIALDGNLLNLTTLKTKEDTLAVLPDHAVAALKAIAPRAGVSPAYFFWTTNSSPHTLGKHWAVRFKRLNAHLNLTDDHGQPMKFHSHQLRDTFAVELLLAGYPIETVSKMLTHKSVRVTETHYAPWVKSRQKQLQVKAIEALRKMGATVGGK
jgi:site-specific recombinase XerD